MKNFLWLLVLISFSCFADQEIKIKIKYCETIEGEFVCSGILTGSSSSSTSSSSSGIAKPEYSYTVENSDELKIALDKIKFGESILLKDGEYGDLSINKKWPDFIDLIAENPLKAKFQDIVIKGDRGGVKFNGLDVVKYDLTNGASKIEINSNLVRDTVYLKNSSDITIYNSSIQTELTGGLHSTRLNSVKNILFLHNWISGAQEDLMAITGDSDNVKIVKNIFFNTKPKQTYGKDPVMVNGVERKCEYNHSDAIQGFGANGLNPRNLLIDGNLFFDDPSDNEIRVGCGDSVTNMQGNFLSDPHGEGYKNVLIKNNLYYIGSPNTIYINGGTENVVVENNTLIPWGNGSGASLKAVERTEIKNTGLIFRNNLAKSIGTTTTVYKIIPGENTIYKKDDIDKIFGFKGMAAKWQDFLPIDEKYNSFGASQELLKIKSGESLPPGPKTN